MADAIDIMKEVARTVIREELRLQVKREDSSDTDKFSITMMLWGEPIGESVLIELSSMWEQDDLLYDLELVQKIMVVDK